MARSSLKMILIHIQVESPECFPYFSQILYAYCKQKITAQKLKTKRQGKGVVALLSANQLKGVKGEDTMMVTVRTSF